MCTSYSQEFNSASQILLYSILQPKVLSALEKEKRYTCSDKVQDTFPIPYSFMLLAGSLKPLAGFANPEDCVTFGKGENAKKYLRTDDRVERVRRAHLNDLENIVPFLGIGLLYSLSGPDLSTAILHFRLFVGARIYHTISYLTPLPQPNRALSFFIGYGVTLSMAYRLLKINCTCKENHPTHYPVGFLRILYFQFIMNTFLGFR
ncbi:PREDICTED: microsomal glutathione S-transferase 1 [Rhinopithecus bieti]|uniref:microsomal glutathione S-transferase 1 n=1 Tax=Rhinopithecus bieti TaxID=61621 RepID=UPI00083C1A21|nr:PREDICTED: microsomal glutathione S-transferase 1 [Rhinopithecus bieti]